jgi:hypothetical protein
MSSMKIGIRPSDKWFKEDVYLFLSRSSSTTEFKSNDVTALLASNYLENANTKSPSLFTTNELDTPIEEGIFVNSCAYEN